MVGTKPKYMELVDWVKEQIDNGTFVPGHKMSSENELVTKFHISRQTVRHAITVLEQEGIIESRRGSGTYINNVFDEQKLKNTMNVAVITTYVEEYIFPSIIQEIERVVSEAGYTIQMAFSHNLTKKERSVLQNILDKQLVDGIIVEPIKSGLPNFNKDLYEEIIKRKIPTLFLNSYYPDINLPHVSMNDKMAGDMVTNYLLSCGHKNIAGIFKLDDGQGRRRYEGYVEALIAAGLPIQDEHILWIDTEDINDLKNESRRVLKRLKGCTACVCYNDVVANKILSICKKNSIEVPGQMSIIGIDNSDVARLSEIPLTTVNNPLKQLGHLAGETILNLMDGKTADVTMELEPELVVRKSVQTIAEGII
ncbi:MAG: GntR family transcriptional regulator [Lachnospiraceae bacterium]|nr:GntR family transcriptional regulator [Lachnospiraceae bacterium]